MNFMKNAYVIKAMSGLLLAAASAAASASQSPLLFEASFEGRVEPTIARGSESSELTGSPRYVEGIRGKAIVLQMNRDTLSYACEQNMHAPAGSLSLWVKPLNYNCTEQRGFKVFWQAGDLKWLLYHYQQNYMLFFCGDGKPPASILSYGRPAKEQWTHYVCTWDKETTTSKLYYNGKLAAVNEEMPPPDAVPARFFIGAATKWATPDGPFETAFDECRLYDRALTDSEIAALYTSYLPPLKTPATTWTAPRLSTAPEIDGVVNDAEWRAAASMTGFTSRRGDERLFSKKQTRCWFGWDDENLYVAFRSPQEHREDVLITVRGRDAAAHTDESYELFLWPDNADPSLYYQIVGSLGALYDAKGAQSDWNGQIKYANSMHDGVFDAEFAIPFADLGVTPLPGMTWKALFARNFVENGPEYSTWSHMNSAYAERDYAGALVFSDSAPAVRMLDWGELNLGAVAPQLELVNMTGKPATLTCDLSLGEAPGKPDAAFHTQATVELEPGESKVIAPAWPSLTGLHRLASLRVGRVGAPEALADFSAACAYAPNLEGTVFAQPSKRKMVLTIDARAIRAIHPNPHGEARLLDDKGRTVAGPALWTSDTHGRAVVTFDTGNLMVGTYAIEADAYGDNKEVTSVWRATWDKLDDRPDWLAHPVGEERRVVKPFTPVEVTRPSESAPLQVGVWGRSFAFDRSLFPSDITTQGRHLLARPILLSGKSNGETWQNPAATVRIVETAPDRARLQSQATVPGLDISARTSIEFDGMLLVTLRLAPGEQPADLSHLTVDIPVKSELATLMHYNGCSASGGGWAGERPENWAGGPHPIVWLGNEDFGLCFFSEGSTGWNVANRNRALELKTVDGAAVFRVNLFDKPSVITEPVEMTFGLIATPLRPLPDNWLCWSWNTVTHLDPKRGLDTPRPEETVISIPWWDESNRFLHERYAWPMWLKEKEWHERKGRKFIKYTQTLALGDTPERRYWMNEWEVIPRMSGFICPRSDWRHLVAAGVRDRINKGQVDGLYFDIAYPRPCWNQWHGCNGEFSILAQRDLRRRFANLFEEADRPYFLFEHMSMNMYGPMMSFATAYLDGEQYYGRVYDDYSKVFSLGYLRAMNTGKNWGLIPQFLPMIITKDKAAAKRASDSLIAMWALHSPVHSCMSWRAGPSYSAANDLDREFKFTPQTKRLGYWESDHVVKTTPGTVKVTLYHKPGSMLVVASNLEDVDIEAVIEIDAGDIGLSPAGLRITHILENQSSPPQWKSSTLSCSIRAKSCVMAIISE